MAIYMRDLKIDITVKRYEEREPIEGPIVTNKPRDMELFEKNEYKNLSLREALKKLVELVVF